MPPPPSSWKVSRKEYDAIVASTGDFEPESLAFMSKVLHRSGLGDETYAPPSLTNVPMSLNMSAARAEFEAVAFGAVKELLNKANVSPKQVGIVITNSSLFNTTPSLSAAIMNHFKMGSNTINYNLGGMGCSGGRPGRVRHSWLPRGTQRWQGTGIAETRGPVCPALLAPRPPTPVALIVCPLAHPLPLLAGVIATDLARQLLEIYPNSYAMVVSTENLTYNWYPGTSRGMLVTNTIFRVGGAAMLFSNKAKDSWWVGAARAGEVGANGRGARTSLDRRN
jgi:hypothetical protein